MLRQTFFRSLAQSFSLTILNEMRTSQGEHTKNIRDNGPIKLREWSSRRNGIDNSVKKLVRSEQHKRTSSTQINDGYKLNG